MRLHGEAVVSGRIQEVVAGKRRPAQIELGISSIHPLQITCLGVCQQALPHDFSLADDNRIAMEGRFVRHDGGVQAADHRHHAPLAESC